MIRLRKITGTVIVAVLLLISCVTARCEAACTTMRFASSPKAVQRHLPDADEMAGMDDCGRSTNDQPPTASFSAMNHASCEHNVCKQDSVDMQKDPAFKISLETLQAVAIVTAFTLQTTPRDSVQFKRPDVPPLRSLSPLEASSNLRV